MHLEEKRMLRRLCCGSEEALAWFIRQYTPYVGAVVYRVIGSSMSPADVEEVTADVFVALWSHAGDIRTQQVKGWLGTVARNTAKNKLREMGQELPLEDDVLLTDGTTPETESEKRDQLLTVRRAVLTMEEPDREIFLRHYYDYQTVERIAEEMALNASTVKSRLRRGREKLRIALQILMEAKGDPT